MPTQADYDNGLHLIQCLDLLVDPTIEALPVDDGTGLGLIDYITQPDPSTNNNSAGLGDRNPTYPNGEPRPIREGGSGVPLTRQEHQKLKAVDDFETVAVGGGSIDSNVLGNDTYSGVPSITIITSPAMGTAGVIGTATSSRIRYTPPATGEGGQDVILYELRAAQSRGKARASLRVTVQGEPIDPFQERVGSGFGISLGTSRDDTIYFNNDVVAGELILLYFEYQLTPATDGDVTLTASDVTDDIGSTYTLAASGTLGNYKQWVFYAFAAASGPCTVTIALSSPGATQLSGTIIYLARYDHVVNSAPIDVVEDSGLSLPAGLNTISPGPVITVDTSLIVSFITVGAPMGTITAGSDGPPATLRSGTALFILVDLYPCDANPTGYTPSATFTDGNNWTAFGLSFLTN